MDITLAHKNWASRPNDEIFSSIPDMLAAAIRKKDRAVQTTTRLGAVSVEATDDDSLVIHRAGHADASISNYAFQQACTKVGYPVGGIVGKVNAPIAASILNHRISKCDPDSEVQMLLDSAPDGSTIRSVTSDSYARFYDADAIRGLLAMERNGWRVPPARPAFEGQKGTRIATEEDLKGLGNHTTVKVGDTIASAGLYMGDRDMFALMVNLDTSVDRGDGNPIFRARMVWNSEVGARTFGVMDCICDYVCSNIILWNCSNVQIAKYRHIGDAVERINKMVQSMAMNPVAPITRELDIIKAAGKYKLGDTLETVVDNVYGLRVDPALTQDVINGAIANAARFREVDGDPYTLLGMERSLTRYSQEFDHADKRSSIDNAAGKLVQHFINKDLLGTIPQ